MMSEKEYSEKAYYIGIKKGNHMNTKVKPDGSVAAIQFTDDGNILDGPLDLIEADAQEIVRNEYIIINDRARTFGEIILEDVIVPVARELLTQALIWGYDQLSKQIQSKVIPPIMEKAKQFSRNAKIVTSGIIDGLSGKEPKALQLKDYRSTCEIVDAPKLSSPSTPCEASEDRKVLRSLDEVEYIVATMQKSAVTLATCIHMLNNTVIADDGSNPEIRIEIQQKLQALSSDYVMSQIDLLLEEKNHGLLDETSRCLLAAFRGGYFLKDDCRIPVSKYLVS